MKKLPKINTAKLLKAALPYIFIGLMEAFTETI